MLPTTTCYLVLLVFLTTTCACLRHAEPSFERISAKGQWMVDPQGRVRIFHGWNSVLKQPPWYDENILNETRLALFKEMGFNAVRLGAMWTGFEPSQGQFNDTYIAIIKDIVSKLKAHGIYTLLDMHQDVISTKFHSYDGVPRWVIDSFPDSKHPYPWPLDKVSQWAEGYLTDAVSNAFQCLYDDIGNSREYLRNFWQKVASIFKGQPNILGYEFINEPWAGDIYSEPSLLEPGVAGRENLAPLYDYLNEGVRQIDNETLVFYEPVTWGMVFNGNVTGSGFTGVPGGAVYNNRSVFSYHYYCWIIQSDNMSQPFPFAKKFLCDGLLEPKVFETVMQDVKRQGGSSFLTEFGLCTITDDRKSEDTQECEGVMRLADKYVQSWLYWDSFFYDDKGEVILPAVKGFSRVYARAIAGTPMTTAYNPDTHEFRLDFIADPSIKAPTEIFIPPFHYPNGPTVSVSPGLKWTYDKAENLVYVTAQKGARFDGPSGVGILPK